MGFGLHLGTRGVAADPDSLRTLARHVDRLGFAYLGFSDHVVFTRDPKSRYPYNESGKHPVTGSGYCLEQLTCLAFAAAVTEKIRLLPSVMVVPHRPAILAAKTLASIDVLSKGRLTVGIGVGWLAEEMAALGAPPYARRGAASDEYIAAFKALWSEPDPRLEGEFVRLENVVFEPKPVQKPNPPIWVGGEGAIARKRTGRIGDGWYPSIRNPKEQLYEPARFAAALADIHGHAEAAGRDPTAIDVAIFAPGYAGDTPVKDRDGKRIPFTGPAAEIAQDMAAFAAAGAKHLIIGFETDSLSEAQERTERFAKDVMPLAH
jgi:probable F420-dependent oxidoreductase